MNEIEILLKKTAKQEERYLLLERMIAAPEIIADNRYWRKLLLEKEGLDDVVSLRRELVRIKQEYEECKKHLDEDELKEIVQQELIDLASAGESTRKRLFDLLAEKSGEDETLLELLPGGNKALPFCEKLFAAYKKYAETMGISVQSTDAPYTLYFSGAGARAKLKEENGVHKSVSDGETVTVTVTLLPYYKSDEKEIDEKDLKIDLFHSSGAGGQNINKVETAIRITHLPTGTVVTCQDERSQLQNKRKALERLKIKLAETEKRDREKERIQLRKAASGVVVRTYYENTGIVSDKNGNKYSYEAFLEGKRRRI